MPAPFPTERELLERVRSRLEQRLREARPETPAEDIARSLRSDRSMLGVIAKTMAMALHDVHLHIAWNGAQMLPDTAELEYLERHAAPWIGGRRPATRGLGFAVAAGTPGLLVPAGLQAMLPSSALAETTAAVAIGGGGTASLPLRALDAGAAGNAAGGAVLPLVTPLPGLAGQAITLDGDGMKGGADVEDDAALLARIIDRIRRPPGGGNAADYERWVRQGFAVAKLRVVPNWTGSGSVGVVVATGTAALPAAPSPAEIAAIAAHLDTLRPVTAEVHVVAAVPVARALTIGVSPDTAAIRAAVAQAWGLYLAGLGIGETIHRSRLSEALSAAADEYRHVLPGLAEATAQGATEVATAGAITWVAA